ncbi:MAG: FtsB family cell division protein [Acidimicrobiales bacterium]
MRHRPWLVASLVALIGVVLLAVFPVRAYIDQQRQRDDLAQSLLTLTAENQRLSERVTWLQQPDTIERLARDRYQLVRPGEEAYAILPDAADPPVVAPAAAPAETAPVHKNWVSRVWSKITSIL